LTYAARNAPIRWTRKPAVLLAVANREAVNPMSKAFVKEDSDGIEDTLPDRRIPPHANLVTREGLAQIEATIARLELDLATAQANNASTAAIARDLRYWNARRITAQLVQLPNNGRVQFGSRVTMEREGGVRQTYRIVGIDEADPSKGTLSYVSPLAQALLEKEAGDSIAVASASVKIVEIA
jgi:transcription elongation GreA/GreB family factor